MRITNNTLIDKLKAEYISYYADVPVQKYAAMFVGKNEDTIIRWRKEDADFADAVQRAKAEWVRKKLNSTKPEFALERLEKSIFSVKNIHSIETNSYNQYVSNNNIDPNTPDNKVLVNDMLNYLMEKTKI